MLGIFQTITDILIASLANRRILQRCWEYLNFGFIFSRAFTLNVVKFYASEIDLKLCVVKKKIMDVS